VRRKIDAIPPSADQTSITQGFTACAAEAPREMCTIVAVRYQVNVRILKRPVGHVDGINLRRYVPGGVYDVSAPIADYLVLQGAAVAEMRKRKPVVFRKKTDRRFRR